MFVGIRNGKIWDICEPLKNKRKREDGILLTEEELAKIIYIEIKNKSDVVVGDTWDFENSINIPDSPLRDTIPEKSEIQKKLEELELRIETLESQLQSTKKL